MITTCQERQARSTHFIREEDYVLRSIHLIMTFHIHQAKMRVFHCERTKNIQLLQIEKSQLEDTVATHTDNLMYARRQTGEQKEPLCHLPSSRMRSCSIRTPMNPKSQKK